MPTPNRNDDLKFTVEIDPDISKVEDATVKMKKDVDDVGKGTKEWEWPDSHRKAAGMLQAAKGGLGGIGGAVGEMVGGPIGAEVGQMLGQVVEQLQNMVSPIQLVNKGWTALDSTLKDIGGTLGPINLAFSAWKAPIQGFADWASSLPIIGQFVGPGLQAAAAVPDIVRSITEQLTRFAAINSPAQFALFTDAVDDTQAVIGRSFVPVLEIMRDSVRVFGDLLANLLPSTGEVREALGDLRETLRDTFADMREAMQDIGPVARDIFISTIHHVGEVLKIASFFARGFALSIQYVSDGLRAIGIHMPRGDFRSSFGAAARPASVQGFEEYQRQLQTAAFSQGTSGGMQTVPNNVSTIRDILERIENRLPSISGGFASIAERLRGPGGEATTGSRAASAAAAATSWRYQFLPPWFNILLNLSQ